MATGRGAVTRSAAGAGEGTRTGSDPDFRVFFFRSRRVGGTGWLEGQQPQQHHAGRRVLVWRQAELGTPVQAQAVEQLGLVGWQGIGQALDFSRIGVISVAFALTRRNRLQHRHALQQPRHFFQS